MIKQVAPLVSAILVAACNNTPDDGSGLTSSDRTALENKAAQNVGCVFEDQFYCSHIIENRMQLSLYFAPEALGNLDPNARNKGMRVTKNFVVEAASSVKQCTKTDDPALLLIKGIEISGAPHSVVGTSPLSAQSKCYITREAS